MTKTKKNRSSATTIYLAILASSGTAAYGYTQQNKTLMVIAIAVLLVYLYKIRKR